ncbi:MAG: AraC family transcriptional regulator [Flavobacteriales bacterium]|nr:AraC family transcriptional regulator [Flavobacteriales bacterium]
MKHTLRIKNISDLSNLEYHKSDIHSIISQEEYFKNDVISKMGDPTIANASIAILVLSGTCTMRINYNQHKIGHNTLILLSSSHLFCFRQCSDDFCAQTIMVSKDFMDEMDSTDMIYKRIKYGVKLYNTPIVNISKKETNTLLFHMKKINDNIQNTGHFYHKEMILNSLFAFYLDTSNIIDHKDDFLKDTNITRHENIVKEFLDILSSNYRKEHKVDFYASSLNISAHYLTLIVKKITGQSPSDFIFEMLYSDARHLLRHSKLSAQQISTALNFSDQSSFGKFFKRKAGISISDYRKNNA